MTQKQTILPTLSQLQVLTWQRYNTLNSTTKQVLHSANSHYLLESFCRRVNSCIGAHVVWNTLACYRSYSSTLCVYKRTLQTLEDLPLTNQAKLLQRRLFERSEWSHSKWWEIYYKFTDGFTLYCRWHNYHKPDYFTHAHIKLVTECAYMVFPQDWEPQVQTLSETPERWDRWRDSQRRCIAQISSTCSPAD